MRVIYVWIGSLVAASLLFGLDVGTFGWKWLGAAVHGFSIGLAGMMLVVSIRDHALRYARRELRALYEASEERARAIAALYEEVRQ